MLVDLLRKDGLWIGAYGAPTANKGAEKKCYEADMAHSSAPTLQEM